MEFKKRAVLVFYVLCLICTSIIYARTRSEIYTPYYGKLGCWPNNTVYYQIYDDMLTEDNINWIHAQIHKFHMHTCIRWVDRRVFPPARPPTGKYVQFQHSQTTQLYSKCHTIERKLESGKIVVFINLIPLCFEGNRVLHEMFHALGFTHEHQRLDRDCYLTIVHDVLERSAYKIISDGFFETWPYDQYSVTHYPEHEFIKTELAPIRPFGSRDEMTEMDIWKLNYRFCGAPSFCEKYPEVCESMVEWENRPNRSRPCKWLSRSTGAPPEDLFQI